MQIGLHSDAGEVAGYLRKIMQDQAPFAILLAVNRTALQAQEAQRRHQREVFQVRATTFVDRAVKLKPRATKAEPVAVLQIDPPGGERRRDILLRHESDTERQPFRGRAMPVPAQQGAQRRIIRRGDPLHPSQWKMRRVDAGVGGFEVYRGASGLYMIRSPDGSGVVMRRTGTGRHGTHDGAEVVFFLRPRTPLDPQLDFVENVTRIVGERWAENMTAAWDRAIASAR